jgi:3-phosphoshikimate 1-carboxyvinyltransferase
MDRSTADGGNRTKTAREGKRNRMTCRLPVPEVRTVPAYSRWDTVEQPVITLNGCSSVQLVRRDGLTVSLSASGELNGTDINVPGDLSSAAFFVLAGCLAAEGELVIDNVGLNPTRTGILRILELMGADLRVEVATGTGAEPVGRLIVRPSELQGVAIPAELVPLAIDEFPMVFVAAALAHGETLVSGAGELRHKESDRISVMVAGLRALGIEVDELPDGARIRGGRFRSGTIDSRGDHRVAMSFAIGAARAAGPVQILDTANVATSFPGFVRQASAVGLAIEADTGG